MPYDPKWKDVEVVGEFTGKKYFGKFCLKPFLTHKERADAIRLAEMYSRGINEDRVQRTFLTTAAFMKFHIVEYDANWWDDPDEMFGLSIEDEQPIYEIAEKLREVQDEVTGKNKKESETKAPEVQEPPREG